MIVSVGGLFMLAYALSYLDDGLSEGYYYVMNWVGERGNPNLQSETGHNFNLKPVITSPEKGIFWLFGHFFIPISCLLFDFIEFSLRMFFYPTNEIIFRECERLEKLKITESTKKVKPLEVEDPMSLQADY